MNREILFRGKRVDNGEWLISEGFLKHKDGTVIVIESDNGEVIITTPVVPETVGQYTGLKDKNGKKIFEGDIVFVTYDYLGYVTCSIDKGMCNISKYNISVLEITGNIHDKK